MEPSNYIWENMGITPSQRRRNFWVAMGGLFTILFFAYQFQFKMQQSVSYFDTYEKIDCSIYHESIRNPNYFAPEDIKDAQIDQ